MNNKLLAEVMGVMAISVVLYRVGFIMIPMFREGLANSDRAMVLKSFTMIV